MQLLDVDVTRSEMKQRRKEKGENCFSSSLASSQESICCQLKSITLFKTIDHRFCMNSNNKISTFKNQIPPKSQEQKEKKKKP